jgi:hypothetical protein
MHPNGQPKAAFSDDVTARFRDGLMEASRQNRTVAITASVLATLLKYMGPQNEEMAWYWIFCYQCLYISSGVFLYGSFYPLRVNALPVYFVFGTILGWVVSIFVPHLQPGMGVVTMYEVGVFIASLIAIFLTIFLTIFLMAALAKIRR